MSNERLKAAQREKNRKRAFLTGVAKYLTHKQAERSIKLEMGCPEAQLWAEVRGAAPSTGWADVGEVADKLAKWFEVEAILCGETDCKNEATTECGYGRCGMVLCETCVVNGHCSYCDKGR